MSVCKYLAAFWTAAAVYTAASLSSGAMGFSAYKELAVERDRQSANLETLGLINEELENTKNSLLYDSDTLTVYARELGYGRENEQYVRIVGLNRANIPYTSPGEVIRTHRPDFIPDRTLKIIAFCSGLAVFGIFLAAGFLKRDDNRDRPEV
jgi:cell division protein FtsB